MAIPKIERNHIEEALRYIDENGVPDQNRSTKYDLVMEDGKKYPPKYVIAIAAKLATGRDREEKEEGDRGGPKDKRGK